MGLVNLVTGGPEVGRALVTHAGVDKISFTGSTAVGPLASEEHLNRVAGYVESGNDQGAQLVTGGERVGGELERGFFYRPTAFAEVKDEMTIAQEEIFGLVLSATPFDDIDEAVARANGTVVVNLTVDACASGPHAQQSVLGASPGPLARPVPRSTGR